MRSVVRLLFAALAVAACVREQPPDSTTAAPSSAAGAQIIAQLEALYAEYDEEFLRLNPIFATLRGDRRYDDRLGDYISPAYQEASRELARRYLDRLLAIDPTGLGGQDRLSYEVFRYDRELELEGYANGAARNAAYLPVAQAGSLPDYLAVFGSGGAVQPFRTIEDYERWLARSGEFHGWVNQAIANMRAGIAAGIVQPRLIVERTLPLLASQVVDDVEQSVFYEPVRNMPPNLSTPEQERLAAAYREHIRTKLVPSYASLHDFMRDEYLPQARESIGLAALAGGEAWYAYLVKQYTTTDLTPRQIHDIGQRETERILAEMERVRAEGGFEGTLQAFFQHLRSDSRFYYREPAELIAGYEAIRERVNAALPQLFGVIPKTDYIVREVEAFRAPSAPPAQYFPGTADGGRPGVFYVNAYKLDERPKYSMEAISLHEASPGHHFQISISQEIERLPAFRRFGLGASSTAFTEGWGLYAESLGEELGMYADPYQYLGKLTADIWRSNRLIVDTGLHHLGWSREQAIDWMQAKAPLTKQEAVSEVERYIAVPGQALAYKIGQLKIRELRSRAEQALGAAFDVRAFHDLVLTGGALPLAVLEQEVDRWIAGQRP